MTYLVPVRAAFLACATLALALAAGPAFAHAKLLSEVPAAEGSSNAAPVTELRLNFSEALNAAFSKVEVKDAAGGPVNATVALDPDNNKVLVVTFATPLSKGEYSVDWSAVSADGHKTTGGYKVDVAQ